MKQLFREDREKRENERDLQSLTRNMEKAREEGKTADVEFYQDFIRRHFTPDIYFLTCRTCHKDYTGHMGSHPDSDAENNLIYCSRACEENGTEELFPFSKSGICLQI